jgi:hypothetical protein
MAPPFGFSTGPETSTVVATSLRGKCFVTFDTPGDHALVQLSPGALLPILLVVVGPEVLEQRLHIARDLSVLHAELRGQFAIAVDHVRLRLPCLVP